MKLEIDLDLDKIDYEAINKQIQDKIADMNIHEVYQIDSKINSTIRKEVENEVQYYFRNGAWCGLNDRSKAEIKNEITKILREFVKPNIDNILNQIPQEELNVIISKLLPKILVDMIASQMKDMLSNYYYLAQNTITKICESKIQNILNR